MLADIRAQAVRLVETLPQKQLADAVRLLELLSKLEQYVPRTDQESDLVSIIQRHLSPEEQQQLDELRDRNQQGDTLNPDDYTALIHLEDQLEKFAVDRLDALMQLADLSNLELATLNHRLKAVPLNSHAIEPGASHSSDQEIRPD